MTSQGKFSIPVKRNNHGVLRRFDRGGCISKTLPVQPDDGNPTPAEIFRVFRETIMATIGALKLLLQESANVRAELVLLAGANQDINELFFVRQRGRIGELEQAAQEMQTLFASLSPDASTHDDDQA
jgi:hypothetical protein